MGLPLTSLLSLSLAAASLSPPSLDVSLRAPWPTGPTAFLLEACEFMAEEDPSGALFWHFLDGTTGALSAAAIPSALAASPHFPLDQARTLLSPITLSVLRVSLAARAASPAVEAHRQLSLQSPGSGACHGGAWVDVVAPNDESRVMLACDATALNAAIDALSAGSGSGAANASLAGRTYAWDHRYPAGSPAAELAAEAAPLTIFYVDASALASTARALHSLLSESARSGRVRAVLRHAPLAASPGDDATTWLTGFGASLDIKSTEYRAMDDRAAPADAAGANVSMGDSRLSEVLALDPTTLLSSATLSSVAGSNWAAGINWSALADAAGPSKSKALAKAQAAAVKRDGRDAKDQMPAAAALPHFADISLLPQQCADLGLQAAAYVMDAAAAETACQGAGSSDDSTACAVGGPSDPLAALVRVTGSFPALAPWLSTLPVPPALREAAAHNTRFVPPGTSTMTLNGIAVEPAQSQFNLFSLFNVLRSEAHTIALLDTLPLSTADRRSVLGLAFKGGAGGADEQRSDGGSVSPTLRVDMVIEDGVGAVLGAPYDAFPLQPAGWVSDIEKDPAFARWSSDLRGLLQPTWQLHQLRRNLYNAVLVLELAPQASLRALQTLLAFLHMRVPIRFGLTILPGASPAESAALTAATLPTPIALPVNRTAVASSLQLALLHAAASARRGVREGGFSFIRALVMQWATAVGEAAKAAAVEEGGDGAAAAAAAMQGGGAENAVAITVEAAMAAYVAASDPTSATGAAGAAWDMLLGGAGHSELAKEAEEALADATGALRRSLTTGSVAWVASRGISTPSMLFNGRVLPGLGLQSEMMGAVQGDLALLQGAVHAGQLDDGVTPSVLHALVGRASRLVSSSSRLVRKSTADKGVEVSGKLESGAMLLPGAGIAVTRFHGAIFAPEEEQAFLALSSPEASPLLAATPYVHAPGTGDEVKSVSLTLMDDLSTPHALASAAALLSFIRAPLTTDDAVASTTGGDEDNTSCLPAAHLPFALCPAPQPSGSRSATARSIRVGLFHIPPLSLDTAPSELPSIGAVVHVASALIIGQDSALGWSCEVRSSDQGPAVAAVVDFARAALSESLAPGGVGASGAGAVLVTQLLKWLSSEDALPSAFKLRPRSASALASGLRVAFPFAAAADQEAAAVISLVTTSILTHAAVAANVARTMLPAALPGTRSVTGGVMRVRGIAANGRLLALNGDGGSSAEQLACGLPSDPSAAAASLDPMVLGACASPGDVSLLAMQERLARGGSVARLLQEVVFPPERLPDADPDALTAEWISSVVMTTASAVAASSRVAAGNAGGRVSGRVALRTQLLEGTVTSFTSRPRETNIAVDPVHGSVGLAVTAIIDPISADAQKAAPLLMLLRDSLGASVTVHLTPPPSGTHAELPVRSFFRYVLPAQLEDTATSPPASVHHPRAVFSWLPSSLLTLKLAVPEPWNVQISRAVVDCDNIRAPSGEHIPVEFSLKDLLVAGQCVDSTLGGGTFPNGLQLQLTPVGEPLTSLSDTLVMQNLGYWQLKAQPGVWAVRLAPGRAQELYNILAPVGGWGGRSSTLTVGLSRFGRFGEGASDGVAEEPALSLDVAVRDFTGPIAQLRVRKAPGREHEALLSVLVSGTDAQQGQEEASPSLFSSISRSLFGSGGSSAASTTIASANGTKPLVHIFSIASGHLYERFLKIMMVAAIKRSPSVRLKFWLVENFLSPQFKATAPALAAEYGSEVGFVTYKWPNWLRGQSEKQRLIWGYKILFLDVLFPLNVTRIIYVDADQVVRSDLRELAEMDLHGAPYAMTPFCDSREETLGYQFWRDGYWKDHLKGRPYHISALFVVDLALFRRSAAGDQLRAVYEQLSRDSSSLANLDQDLPNFAQHSIPIHSLPQEWLWCDSWCSDAEKPASKTIDLCNNPITREPKLSMARRVISGPLFAESWDELDAEVRDAEARILRVP